MVRLGLDLENGKVAPIPRFLPYQTLGIGQSWKSPNAWASKCDFSWTLTIFWKGDSDRHLDFCGPSTTGSPLNPQIGSNRQV